MATKNTDLGELGTWKRVFLLWAGFFSLLYLASLAMALRFHASLGRDNVLGALFIALFWIPPMFCRWRMFIPASIVSIAIGVTCLVRVIMSYGSLAVTIRRPSIQGSVAEAAVLATSVSTTVVYLLGGLKIYRVADVLKNRAPKEQSDSAEN